MLGKYENEFEEHEPGVTSIISQPKFAIGQRAYIIQTAEGNVLWDCISLLDDLTIQRLRSLGGVSAIAISHPRYHTTMVHWSRRVRQCTDLLPYSSVLPYSRLDDFPLSSVWRPSRGADASAGHLLASIWTKPLRAKATFIGAQREPQIRRFASAMPFNVFGVNAGAKIDRSFPKMALTMTRVAEGS